VFYEKSPRRVTAEQVREIVKELPDNVERIGVFVNEQKDSIFSIVDAVGLTGVQMHGDREDPRVADWILERRPQVKVLTAISMNHPDPRGWAMRWPPDKLQAFVVDSGSSSKHGGTGEVFDWAAAIPVVEDIKRIACIVAAGGLTSSNVGEAIRILKPWGVDVVSGVEARPGKKDPNKVHTFIGAVREMDRRVG